MGTRVYPFEAYRGPPPAYDDYGKPENVQAPLQQTMQGYTIAPEIQTMQGQVVYAQVPTVKMGGYAALEGRNGFLVKQRVEIGEAIAGQLGCPCYETENKYDIYDMVTGEHLLFAEEKSDDCERMCCAPNHGLDLVVYDARPGVPPRSMVFMTMKRPFKVNCCIVSDVCAGRMEATLADGTPIGTAEQPRYGGYFNATIETFDEQKNSFAKVTGPSFCFGGIAELCQDQQFNIRRDGHHVGRIVKKAPEGMEQLCVQGGTDADNYTLEVPASFSLQERAVMLANLLLLDYLWFESGPLCQHDPWRRETRLNLCNVYCCGCVVPFKLKCQHNNENSIV